MTGSKIRCVRINLKILKAGGFGQNIVQEEDRHVKSVYRHNFKSPYLRIEKWYDLRREKVSHSLAIL